MTKEELIDLKKRIANLSEEELIQRDLYLKKVALGEIDGPLVGYPTIDKPWLKYYSDKCILDAPLKVNVYEFLKNSSKDIMNDKAISYMGKLGRQLSFKKMFDEIDTIAKSFMELGIKKGDMVTISLANTPEFVTSFYALAKIGAVANIIDPRLKEDKLINVINSTNSKIILNTDVFSDNLGAIIDKTTIEKAIIVSPFDSLPFVLKKIMKRKNGKIKLNKNEYIDWDTLKKYGELSNKEVDYEVTIEDPACIVYTSGTTGAPKGVVLTHKNFIYMANQARYCGYIYSKNGSYLNQVPTFLGYNIFITVTNPLHAGLHLIMLPDYNPDKFTENMLKYKAEGVNAGPADWDNFLKNAKGKNFSFLKTPISGSDKIDESKKEEINKIMKADGSTAHLLEGYGMSEIASAATTNLPQATFPDSVGVPLKNTIVGIFNPDNKTEELPYDVVGEICFKSNTIMKGYYNNVEETNRVLIEHEDGLWLHSGDLGYISKDGALYLKGRIKRVIINYEGFKISPYDLEKIIMNTGFVDECCVVGVNDLEHGRGNIPIAAIVIKEEFWPQTENIIETIMQSCAKQLGDRYQLKDIVVYDKIPLTANNKIDYRFIQEEINQSRKSNYNKVLK